MSSTEKQAAGFKFGKYRTTLIRECGEFTENGRIYKLVLLKTSDGNSYFALRLYNSNRHFIKQFLFEPWLLNALIDLLISEANRA